MEKTSKELLKEFVNSQHFTSTTDIMNSMKELFSDVLQTVMEAELEEKLGYEKSERTPENAEKGMSKNYRNGYSKKTVKTQLGEVDVKIPRDRNGEYEPQIIEKYSRNADGMEEKILALYSCGMSQRDISEQIKNLYNVDISDGLVSKIVEKITPEIAAWQNHPLDAVSAPSASCADLSSLASSVYQHNCSDQKTVIVDNDVLEVFQQTCRDLERERNWKRRHGNRFIFLGSDENFDAKLGLITHAPDETVESDLYLEYIKRFDWGDVSFDKSAEFMEMMGDRLLNASDVSKKPVTKILKSDTYDEVRPNGT